MVDRCNRMIERNLKDAGTIVDTKFAYDATSRKISVHVGADNVITLSSDLASIMGFSPRQHTFREERKHKGKVAMDPNRGFNSLYVYCDAAEAIPVGDIKAPLLRVVDAAANFGDLIHRLYTTPQYVPVSRKEFNTVEIDIRDDTGRPVHYTFAEAGIPTSYHEKPVLLRCQQSAIRRLLYEAKRRRGTSLLRFYGLPFLSSGAKILGQQAMNVASDVIDGKWFQNSAKSRFKEIIKTFVKSNPIIPQSGCGVRRKHRRQSSRKQSKSQNRRGLQIFLHSMAFIHDQSCECAKTELDIFSVPPTQTGIEYGNYVEYHPLSSITDSGPIEFDVSSSGQNYLDFANTQLLVKAKITSGNGDDITDADHVGGVNLFLHSLFHQVDVSLNDVQVSQSAGTYAYRAYIESLLSYGPMLKPRNSQQHCITRILSATRSTLTQPRGTRAYRNGPRLRSEAPPST